LIAAGQASNNAPSDGPLSNRPHFTRDFDKQTSPRRGANGENILGNRDAIAR
jgi:hypothetical protein